MTIRIIHVKFWMQTTVVRKTVPVDFQLWLRMAECTRQKLK